MNRDHLTRRQAISLATATAAASLFPARAEAAWPNKAIRFVVPFAPGGSSEIVARATAAELAKLLGQSVFVDNKPGGAGNVAMGEVARADDQHTLILGHIGTLAVECCRIVAEEKHLQQCGETHHLRVELDLNHLRVPCSAAADFFVGGLGVFTTGIARGHSTYAPQAFKYRFQTPETPAPDGSQCSCHELFSHIPVTQLATTV